MSETELVGLKEKARRLRQHVLTMINRSQAGHPGGALSCVEIITALYFHKLRVRPNEPQWEDRDRFVLSKGHGCAALYAALAELGFFPLSELYKMDRINGILQAHPDMRKTPGVDMSTGSLGQGLSVAVGMALGAKLKNATWCVYTLLGDGELCEGQIWEAALSASKFRLDNLTAIVDRNRLQLVGRTEDAMPLEPLALKWEAFGWRVDTVDGHNLGAILMALEAATKVEGKPTVIIANTVKGRGVSFMEDRVEWHSKAPTDEELSKALKELGVDGEESIDG